MSAATGTQPAAIAAEHVPEDHVIVLFGATGDLARRKLLPGIFHLAQAGLMPRRFRVIGVARHDVGEDGFREMARRAVEDCGRRPPAPEAWDSFAECLRFVGVGEGLDPLAEALEGTREEVGEDARILHYLSLPPHAAGSIARALGELGLGAGARVVIEKPFGVDLASARELNACLLSVFDEDDIFRIDHYIGREAVQNLLALRFANGMFEPVWNRNHIDHVQIDVPETLSIGMRTSFYEETGAFRDMVVTHLFQVLSFVAMEPPVSLEAKQLTIEREKVFDSMPPLDPAGVVRGQYDGYRDEEGVAADSDTETFVALRAFVDNWRWDGVPFYLRSGKRLAEDRHVLTVAFSQPPRRMFPLDCEQVAESFGHDHLTFELGDPGSISASFLAKVPGPTMHLGEAHMRFSYADNFGGSERALDAYERLIHDVLLDDRTLFTSSDGIERLWEVSEPLLEDPPPVRSYAAGSWGPEAIDDLIAPRRWHLPSPHVD
ncbi:MAG TPA: glucose-6-phosphate dehydrogenase [Solirubrobacterales bacterium]|nr:glucose-6-phosphate dehydrogenase [Solirubrobacterales bacterium]